MIVIQHIQIQDYAGSACRTAFMQVFCYYYFCILCPTVSKTSAVDTTDTISQTVVKLDIFLTSE